MWIEPMQSFIVNAWKILLSMNILPLKVIFIYSRTEPSKNSSFQVCSYYFKVHNNYCNQKHQECITTIYHHYTLNHVLECNVKMQIFKFVKENVDYRYFRKQDTAFSRLIAVTAVQFYELQSVQNNLNYLLKSGVFGNVRIICD